ncbi:MAG: hypothetical protein DMF72_20075 [Acidobacteria bacterium]|nr:MAG: hypothetical protein DMF72_20075 [Acidobacteriota bacterium]
MAFNVKSIWTSTVARNVLSKPAGMRHGMTGFWVASVPRIQKERIVRMAYLPNRRFVLEAEIDAGGTHVMAQSRFDEYLEYELLKRSQGGHPLPVAQLRNDIQTCINRGRIVVAFRNARAYSGNADESGRNPIWYTDD